MSRALTVTSAIVWTYVLEGFVLIRVGGGENEVGIRLVAFGMFLTYSLAKLVSMCQKEQDRLMKVLEAEAKRCSLTSSTRGVPSPTNAANTEQTEQKGEHSLTGVMPIIESRAATIWRGALAEFLRLVESSSGWLVGCVWTDALFAFIGQQSVLVHSGFALALLLLSALWLILSGEDDTLERAEAREEGKVRRYFVTNALAFIVGWAWVLVLFALEPHMKARPSRSSHRTMRTPRVARPCAGIVGC